MKKSVVPIILGIIFAIGGAASFVIGLTQVKEIIPTDFNTLSYSEINNQMFIGSDATIVYDSFAFFGKDEANADELFYITITGMGTEEGAQYMPFAIDASNKILADAHIEKTIAWEIDENLDSPTPTGFPIQGVVKPLSKDAKAFFVEYFVESGMYTQDDVDTFPELFSDYYIDTNSAGSSAESDGLIMAGIGLLFLALIMLIVVINNATINKNKARLAYNNTSENIANTSLSDSNDVPLGFE